MNAPTKKRPGATGRDDYGGAYKLLCFIQRPFFAVGWLIDQECARIETVGTPESRRASHAPRC